MGYIELEQFTLCAGVSRGEFYDLDDAVQAWSYIHREGLRRRTTALSGDGSVLVVTLHQSSPHPLGLDGPPGDGASGRDALDGFRRAIEPGTYERSVFQDRG